MAELLRLLERVAVYDSILLMNTKKQQGQINDQDREMQ